MVAIELFTKSLSANWFCADAWFGIFSSMAVTRFPRAVSACVLAVASAKILWLSASSWNCLAFISEFKPEERVFTLLSNCESAAERACSSVLIRVVSSVSALSRASISVANEVSRRAVSVSNSVMRSSTSCGTLLSIAVGIPSEEYK